MSNWPLSCRCRQEIVVAAAARRSVDELLGGYLETLASAFFLRQAEDEKGNRIREEGKYRSGKVEGGSGAYDQR